jgi:hypothetical protein
MIKGRFSALVATVCIAAQCGLVVAQGPPPPPPGSQPPGMQGPPTSQRYVRHNQWRKGRHISRADWRRGQRIDDWQRYHLRQPPRGYEWREVDGNYVLAGIATGLIASAVIAAAASNNQ